MAQPPAGPRPDSAAPRDCGSKLLLAGVVGAAQDQQTRRGCCNSIKAPLWAASSETAEFVSKQNPCAIRFAPRGLMLLAHPAVLGPPRCPGGPAAEHRPQQRRVTGSG
jgi:hypothetical protein